MSTLEVYPRETPATRAEERVEIAVDEDVSVFATIVEDWVGPRQNWDFTLREGTELGRQNNVEGQVLFAAGEQTSSLTFRLDQLDAVDDTGAELVLRLEERDGIAKLARLSQHGLDVELHHILTFT